MTSQTALVTGASGFIGRHLTAALTAHGWRVRCLVRPTSTVRPLRRSGAELYWGDVLQPAALAAAIAGVDVVFHLAGLTKALTAAEMMRVNGEGTGNVAQACAAQECPPVLIVCSSLAAAGPTPEHTIRTEADPPAPISDYGRSKRAGELAAAVWADRVPTTVIRPGVVFGEWDRLMYPMFRAIWTTRIHVVPTFAPPPLSLIHVHDLVRLFLAAADHGPRIAPAGDRLPPGRRPPGRRPPGYYFATMAEYPTWTQLGRMTAQLLNRRHVCVLHLPEPVPWIAGIVGEWIGRWRGWPATVTRDKMREAIAPSWASSPDAAREELGVTAARSLHERLSQTVHWYRTRRWLA